MTKSLYSYSPHSQGAKALAEAMRINRIKHEGSRFRGSPDKTIINWGCSELPEFVKRGPRGDSRIINKETSVQLASDKLKFMNRMKERGHGAYVPPFTTEAREALSWLDQGHSVVARKLLRASSARGLEIIDPGEELPDAPLYTRYMKKNEEYRIHVANGGIIDKQRKGLREEFRGQDDINWRVRNLANGFVFVRNDDHVYPGNVLSLALLTVRNLDLHFGAVDIIRQRNGNVYALEVNTAPGLMGSTIDNYAQSLKNL